MGVRISNLLAACGAGDEPLFISVGKTPGAIAFTEIPSRAHSQARLRVRESSAVLAGAVSGDFVEREERTERGDVDDAPPSARFQGLIEGLAGAQGAGQIGVDQSGPLLFAHLDRRLLERVARGVHQNVDSPEVGRVPRRAGASIDCRDRLHRRFAGVCVASGLHSRTPPLIAAAAARGHDVALHVRRSRRRWRGRARRWRRSRRRRGPIRSKRLRHLERNLTGRSSSGSAQRSLGTSGVQPGRPGS